MTQSAEELLEPHVLKRETIANQTSSRHTETTLVMPSTEYRNNSARTRLWAYFEMEARHTHSSSSRNALITQLPSSVIEFWSLNRCESRWKREFERFYPRYLTFYFFILFRTSTNFRMLIIHLYCSRIHLHESNVLVLPRPTQMVIIHV